MNASVGSWTVPRVRIFFLPIPPGRAGRGPCIFQNARAKWIRPAQILRCAANLRRLSRRPICDGAPEGKENAPYSSSSLSTAMNASVGSWTVPNVRIFFLPSFCFSSSFFFRVMSPP